MKVFVAGASGAIGRPLVRQLVEAGHEVTGMTRREERAVEIRAAGANAVVCDALDREALATAVGEAAPEAVVHELTALPHELALKGDFLEPTNRLRTEGTRNLLDAARTASARRFVSHSVAFFYEFEGPWIKDEEASLLREAPRPFGAAARAIHDLERQVTSAEGIEGIVLRYGWFYGPGTHFAADGWQAKEARRRRLPIVGKGTGTYSFIHVEDAAAATAAAVEQGAPGIYNVVDDDPAPMREWVPLYADAVGAKKPMRVPTWLAQLVAGRATEMMAIRLRGASNAKAKRELGWQPRYPSWSQGFREALG
jgi:nucleoside-diphosphate-sugar epimerase